MKSVLILEDNPFILDQISKMMREDGWDVHEFSKVDKAFSFYKSFVENQKKEPDILLLDLFMPGFPWNRISATVLDEVTWLLPLYTLLSIINKQKEWGGRIFLRTIKDYISQAGRTFGNDAIKRGGIMTFSRFSQLSGDDNDSATPYIRRLVKEICEELTEDIGVKVENIIPKPDFDLILDRANNLVQEEK